MKNNIDPIALVDSLAREGRYQEAIRALDAAIAATPDSARLWANKGWCLYQMEQFGPAIQQFSEALRLKPDASTTYFFRAQCKEKTGDLSGALEDYSASVAIRPQPDAFLNIGLIHKFTGNLASAKEAFTQALRLDPSCELAANLLSSLSHTESV